MGGFAVWSFQRERERVSVSVCECVSERDLSGLKVIFLMFNQFVIFVKV